MVAVSQVVVAAPGVAVVAAAVVVLLLVVKRSGVYHLAFVPIAALEVDHVLEFCHPYNAQFELFAVVVAQVAAVVVAASFVLLLVVKRPSVYHLAFVPIAALEVDHALEFCHH